MTVDRIATANVLHTLPDDVALRDLETMLALDLDGLVLVEWSPDRWRLLPADARHRTAPRRPWAPGQGMTYARPRRGTGLVVAMAAARYELTAVTAVKLSGRTRVGGTPRHPRAWKPANYAAVTRWRDHVLDEDVTVIGYHLVSGVQTGRTGYRHDDPARVALHRRQVAALEAIIAAEEAAGRTVYAAGDSNYHRLDLKGLVSAWQGHHPTAGTAPGSDRLIDDVYGPGPTDVARIVQLASDHAGAIAVRTRGARPMPTHHDAAIDVLSVNVHTGRVILEGGLAWLLDRFAGIDLVLIQEASHPAGRRQARRLLPRRKWHAIGPRTGQTGGTFVYARRARFRKLGAVNELITPSIPGDGMHPARRLNALLLRDRITGRVVNASSVHTWHIVGRDLGQDNRVVNGHVAQVIAYADHHADHAAADPSAVQLAGGDWNEDLDAAGQPRNAAAPTMARRANMAPAYRLAEAGDRYVRLDDVLVNRAPFVEVLRRRVVEVPVKSADHPAVWVRLDTKALR